MTSPSRFFFESRLRPFGLLVAVDAIVRGPAGERELQLVLDTGAESTTLTPEVVASIGYGPEDRFDDAGVSTVVGREDGYWLHVAELDVVGIHTFNFALTVFPLPGVDGLLGMNFLRYLNLAIRLKERRVIVELIDPSALITG